MRGRTQTQRKTPRLSPIHWATNLNHASGAFTAGQPKPLGNPIVFETLVLPVLTDFASVHHRAAPTLSIVVTPPHHADRRAPQLRRLQERAAADTTGHHSDPDYIIESLGLDAALDMINRGVADHRELVLGDQNAPPPCGPCSTSSSAPAGHAPSTWPTT
ncbi:hypothetical protein ACIA5D_47630 [Actinoplanes sp. NPDC051513]|uniref:hypothetical protein n=1 Tax=Actinoplanes sp. NPDC051513 TaxID=3363908 RepID=UPI0037AFB967